MSKRISYIEPFEVSVCVILKYNHVKGNKLEYSEVSTFMGDWSDLAFELYSKYGQFKQDVDALRTKKEQHEKLDQIGVRLANHKMSYEFVMPDGTDDWYVAHCKPIEFRLDRDGKLS